MKWALILLGVGVLMWGCRETVERALIYVPSRELIGSPETMGLTYRDVWFEAEDGVRLHGWYVPGRLPITLLWCHGNAGNISHRLDNIREIHRRLGLGVFIFDYRGYGRSDGRPGEAGLYRDARAARAALIREGPSAERIVYFGRSLGAAVAVELALAAPPPPALILETPFLSVAAMANRVLPGAGLLFKSRYDSLGRIGQLRSRLLILHGDADEVVPHEHGRRLFEAAPEPKAFYTIRGAHHNDTYLVGGRDYWAAWARFIGSVFPDAGGQVTRPHGSPG
ncbi:MAG: alpha/beta hydrolase [Candidatus Rokubacteria bacterium]|nr:alpha/beta hydrolase [Candidatus Rokubacteria bacterium]